MKYIKNQYVIGLASAFFINLLIETFSRHSLVQAFAFLADRPLIFFYNTSMILATLSLVLLVRRKVAFFTLIALIWLGFGVANGLTLASRVFPLTWEDIAVSMSIITIVSKYFSVWQVSLLAFVVILILFGLVMIFIKGPKYQKKMHYRYNTVLFIAIVAGFFTFNHLAIRSKLLPTVFGNLNMAYEDYGFPYGFTSSIFNFGIARPKKYSASRVYAIEEHINERVPDNLREELKSKKKLPNIVMIQLESFFDPTLVTELTFSEDPVPNFRMLKDKYSSGFLRVPVVGAGTVNTEFEVLTGMAVEFFGPGEIPYQTILSEKPVESVPFNLKDLGYGAHVLHNNTGTFYDRDQVFKALGFDTFISSEYMNLQDFSPIGWPKDWQLEEPLLDVLASTESPDFVYLITVQSHGDYPEDVDYLPQIRVTGWEDEERLAKFEYYVNQIHEVDVFIGDVIKELSKFEEDTVVIMYGDHLPTFYFTDDELANHDMYQTEYVFWSNFKLPEEDTDLFAYQLSSHVLSTLGIHHGTMMNFHESCSEDKNYKSEFKILQYDLLYGNDYVFGRQFPYTYSDLQYGLKSVTIIAAYNDAEENLIVEGENFTPSSRISVNGKNRKTTFVSPQKLILEARLLKEGDVVAVDQVADNGTIMSTTGDFIPQIRESLTGANDDEVHQIEEQ